MPLQRSFLAPCYSLIKILLTFSILVYIFYKIFQDWNNIRALEIHWNIFYLSISLSFGIIAYIFLVINWMLILHCNGYFKKDCFKQYFRIWLTSYFYRYIPGRVMLVIERVRKGSHLGIPVIHGTIIASLEVLFIMYAALLWSFLIFPTFFENKRMGFLTAAAIIIFMTIFLPLFFRHADKFPYLSKYFVDIASLQIPPTLILCVTFFSLLFWGGMGISFFFFTRMFFDLNISTLPYICALFAFAYASGLISVLTPGGVGVREGIIAFGLIRFMPAAIAGTSALAARIWFTIVEFILLGIVLTIVGPSQVDSHNNN